MMTSKNKEWTLCSLLLETDTNYDENLQKLVKYIKECKEFSLIVAPEVYVTGFDYDNLDKALAFAELVTQTIKKLSINKIIIFTMLEKRDAKIYNIAKVFYNEEVVYERAKARLFRLGNEHKFMQEGSDEDFKVIEVAGIKIVIFICFELRFKELWIKAEGADIIVLPSWWGKQRTEHFKSLTKTLAILNQCYLVASDSYNTECTQKSSIISPKGEVFFNENQPCLELAYKQKEIDVIRRYIDVGIK